MNWQNYPLIRLAIPFTLGMVGANLFFRHMNMAVLLVLCCAVLAFLFFLVQTADSPRDGKFGVVGMALFFLVGMALYTGKHRHTAEGLPADTTFCQGILSDLPQEKARTWALNIEQEDGTHLLLYVGKNHEAPHRDSTSFAALQLGDTIRARTLHLQSTDDGTDATHATATRAAHGDTTGTATDETFRTFHRYLFHQGICATAYVPRGQWAARPAQPGQPSLRHRAQNLQHTLHRIYDGRGIGGEAGSVVEAMTIGRKAQLSPATRQAYATAGVSHLLALSGFHVGIITFLLSALLLGSLLPLRWQWVSRLLLILTLWGYTFLAGMAPSLVRATLMYSIILCCLSFSRGHSPLNTCALAMLVMLCINPFYLQDIGFQLSFISVGGIILFAFPALRRCSAHHPLLRLLEGTAIISAVCAIATAPLAALHFGRISALSLVSNFALLPFVYVIVGGGILWWLFLWCEPVNTLLTALLNWAADTMNGITGTFSSLPFASIEWRPNALTALLCYLALLAIAYLFNTKLRKI